MNQRNEIVEVKINSSLTNKLSYVLFKLGIHVHDITVVELESRFKIIKDQELLYTGFNLSFIISELHHYIKDDLRRDRLYKACYEKLIDYLECSKCYNGYKIIEQDIMDFRNLFFKVLLYYGVYFKDFKVEYFFNDRLIVKISDRTFLFFKRCSIEDLSNSNLLSEVFSYIIKDYNFNV